MKKDAVLFHLREALEELQATIQVIQRDLDHGREQFTLAMSRLHHHLSTA